MTSTAFVPTGRAGVRRAVADELESIGALVQQVAWPPWIDPRLTLLISKLRHTLDGQLERDQDELPAIAARLGLDFEALRATAGDVRHVRRWVAALAGKPEGEGVNADVVAELLIVNLFTDELAYIGLLSRPVGPTERVTSERTAS